MEIEIQVSQAVSSIYQELLTPLANFKGSYTVLKGKVPLDIVKSINAIEQFTEELLKEIRKPFQQTRSEFDFSSPTRTVMQIRQKATKWKKQMTGLSDSLKEIQNARDLGMKLSDPTMDDILSKNLFQGFEQLDDFLFFLENLEEKDLLETRPAFRK
jgi:hypothetical protein